MKKRQFTKAALLAFSVIALVLLVTMASLNRVSGQTDKTKTVTSVCIQAGDSLWSIAEAYYTEECGDFREYISEIRRTNHLPNNDLTAGNYLLVPYYK